MKIIVISSFALVVILISCKSKQKVAETPTVTATENKGKVVSKNGIYEPGENELSAIKLKYPETTQENLQNGYAIYIGVCTNCHGAKSIYSRSIEKWPKIIDEMAPQSKLSQQQKDDLSKYVFSIKATQPLSNQ